MEVRVTRERALGRSRAYGVFAALYRAGVTAELLPIVEAIPELAAQVARPFDAEEAAAAHQGLFGFQVFPFQSVFLGEDGLLGGAEGERVRAAHRAAGYAPGAMADDPDHLAHELALLSFLCGAEADAHADGRAEMAAVARRQQAAVLGDHLLWWLPLFVPAVARQGDGFYAALAGLTWALVLDHWQDVGGAADGARWAPGGADDADAANEPAAGDAARQIGAHLLRPVRSGLFVSRADLARCARQAGLPHGFGDRRQMAATLLDGAARFDRSAALAAALGELVAGAQAAWAAPELAPAPAAIRRFWLARLARTAALIGGLG